MRMRTAATSFEEKALINVLVQEAKAKVSETISSCNVIFPLNCVTVVLHFDKKI